MLVRVVYSTIFKLLINHGELCLNYDLVMYQQYQHNAILYSTISIFVLYISATFFTMSIVGGALLSLKNAPAMMDIFIKLL